MIKVNIREFRKNLAKYLLVPVTVMKRDVKVATVRPIKQNEKANRSNG